VVVERADLAQPSTPGAVTQEFTLEAGRGIWALPKWLARCDLAFGRPRATVHLAEEDTFVLAAVLDSGRVPVPLPVTTRLPTFSVRPDGTLLRGAAAMRVTGLRVRPGGTRVVLGEHRMAAVARALGIGGRPLFTVTAPAMTMELGEWDAAP